MVDESQKPPERTFAEKAKNASDTFMLLDFLTDPSRSVAEYLAADGPIPDNFVDTIKSLLPIAQLLGFNIVDVPDTKDFIEKLTADNIADLLLSDDGIELDGPTGTIKVDPLSKEKFVHIFNSNEFFRTTIAEVLSGAQKEANIKDAFALGFGLTPEDLGMDGGDMLLSQKAINVSSDDYANIIKGLNDEATLKILHKLPYQQAQEVLDGLSQNDDGETIDGFYIPELDEDASPEDIKTAIDEAIQQRMEHEIKSHNETYDVKGSLAHNFFNALDKDLGDTFTKSANAITQIDDSVASPKLFAAIREKLAPKFGSGFKVSLKTPIDPETLIATSVYKTFQDDKENARELIKDNWATIQEALKKNDMIGVLMDAMGLNEKLQAGMLEGIKAAFSSGPLAFLGNILRQFFNFVKPFVQKFFPGAKLSVDYDQVNGTSAVFDAAAGGAETQEQEQQPAPEEEAPTHNGGTKNELGR